MKDQDKTWVYYCIEDAMKTIHSTVGRVGPKKYKTFWPTKPGELSDEDKIEKWNGDVGHMDIVLFEWFKLITDREVGILYLRHGGRKPVPYGEIAKKLHCSREKVRLEYYSCLSYLEHKVPKLATYNQARIARICSRLENY